MAGRNWTRKSIEELVKDYLNKHGSKPSGNPVYPALLEYSYSNMNAISMYPIMGTSPYPVNIPNKWDGDIINQPNQVAVCLKIEDTIKNAADTIKTGYIASTFPFNYNTNTGFEYIYFYHSRTVTRIKVESVSNNTLLMSTGTHTMHFTDLLSSKSFMVYNIYSPRMFGTTDVIDFLITTDYAEEDGTWLFCSEELTEDNLLTDYYTTYEEVTL